MSREEKNYLDSCKEMVEVHHDIKEAEQCKRKIQDTLDEVNDQLLIMQKHYKYLETRNMLPEICISLENLSFLCTKLLIRKEVIQTQMLSLNNLIMMN